MPFKEKLVLDTNDVAWA